MKLTFVARDLGHDDGWGQHMRCHRGVRGFCDGDDRIGTVLARIVSHPLFRKRDSGEPLPSRLAQASDDGFEVSAELGAILRLELAEEELIACRDGSK